MNYRGSCAALILICSVISRLAGFEYRKNCFSSCKKLSNDANHSKKIVNKYSYIGLSLRKPDARERQLRFSGLSCPGSADIKNGKVSFVPLPSLNTADIFLPLAPFIFSQKHCVQCKTVRRELCRSLLEPPRALAAVFHPSPHEAFGVLRHGSSQ